MVISFSSEKPRARLLKGRRVYTVRKRRRLQFVNYPKSTLGRGLNDWANAGRTKPKIADVIIFEVSGEPIEARHFHIWAAWSGFENIAEWVAEIERLNGDAVSPWSKFYLYMVQERDAFFKPGSSRMDGANK